MRAGDRAKVVALMRRRDQLRRGGNPHATAQAGAAGPGGVAASVLGDKPNGDADKPKAGDGKRARQGVPKS